MPTTTIYGAGAQIATNDADIATNVSDINALEAGLPNEIEAVGTVGAPNVIAASESRTVISNEGTLGVKNGHTLPTAAAGLTFTFICNDVDGIRIVASALDTIRINGSISVVAGYMESVVIGSVVTVVAIDATEWIATTVLGTWLLETS